MFRHLLRLGLFAALWSGLSAQAPRPGYVSGTAVNEAGAPLSGVRIRVFGTTDAGQRSSLNTRTKNDGTFSLRLPAGNFSLRDAVWPTNYNGRAYALPLHLEGEDNDDFDSTEGATARLVLKMSGKVARTKNDTDERAWFGGTIELEFINADGTSADLPDHAQWKITLTPRDTLMDGSPAKVLNFTRPLNFQRANRIILNVPLADYDATAALVNGNSSTPLLLSSREPVGAQTKTPLARTAPVTFAPISGDVPLMNGNGVEKSVLQLVIPAQGALDSSRTRNNGTNNRPVSPSPSAAPTGKWRVGDHLNVLRTPRLDQWHAGVIREIKGDLYLIKFDAFGEEHNEWVDASRLKPLDRPTRNDRVNDRPPTAQWRVGDRLNVLRTPRLDQWHTGVVREIKGDRYLIKFDAFGEEHNEWVDASRLKPL